MRQAGGLRYQINDGQPKTQTEVKMKAIKTMTILALFLCVGMTSSQATQIYGTADPNANLLDYRKPLNPGVRYIVEVSDYQGFKVSSNQIVMATHVGVTEDMTFSVDGKHRIKYMGDPNGKAVEKGAKFGDKGITYTVIDTTNAPSNHEVQVLTVDKAFTEWGEIGTEANVIGKLLFITGRGLQSGDDVFAQKAEPGLKTNTLTLQRLAESLGLPHLNKQEATALLTDEALTNAIVSFSFVNGNSVSVVMTNGMTVTNSVLVGRKFGLYDGVARYCVNRVSRISGHYAVCTYDDPLHGGEGFYEGYLAFGDSSGPGLDEQGRLVTLNYGISAPISDEPNGYKYFMSSWDMSGFYWGDYQIPAGNGGGPNPESIYLTRLTEPQIQDWLKIVLHR